MEIRHIIRRVAYISLVFLMSASHGISAMEPTDPLNDERCYNPKRLQELEVIYKSALDEIQWVLKNYPPAIITERKQAALQTSARTKQNDNEKRRNVFGEQRYRGEDQPRIREARERQVQEPRQAARQATDKWDRAKKASWTNIEHITLSEVISLNGPQGLDVQTQEGDRYNLRIDPPVELDLSGHDPIFMIFPACIIRGSESTRIIQDGTIIKDETRCFQEDSFLQLINQQTAICTGIKLIVSHSSLIVKENPLDITWNSFSMKFK